MVWVVLMVLVVQEVVMLVGVVRGRGRVPDMVVQVGVAVGGGVKG